MPFTHQEIRAALKFLGRVDDDTEFPRMTISPLFARDRNIVNFLGKTTSSFNMKDSPYNLDFSIYRKWGTNILEKPLLGAGIELYGDHWDSIMGKETLAGSSRDWEEDLSGFFPDDFHTDKNGLETFFRHALKVQDWLGEVSEKEPSKPAKSDLRKWAILLSINFGPYLRGFACMFPPTNLSRTGKVQHSIERRDTWPAPVGNVQPILQLRASVLRFAITPAARWERGASSKHPVLSYLDMRVKLHGI